MSTTDADPAVAKLKSRISWAARILPQMERQDLWDRIVNGDRFSWRQEIRLSSNRLKFSFARPTPTSLACRITQDSATLRTRAPGIGNRALALLVSTDFLAAPGNANMGDTKDNGLFMNLTLGTVNNRLSNIKDGAGTTLMLSENVNKNENYNWLGVSRNQAGEQQFGMVWVVPTSGTTPTFAPPGSTLTGTRAVQQVRRHNLF